MIRMAFLLAVATGILMSGCSRFALRGQRTRVILPEKPRMVASATPIASTNMWRPALASPSNAAAPAAIVASTPPVAPVRSNPPPLSVGHDSHTVAYRLRPMDPIVINLRGIPPKDDQVEDQIDESGFIRLTYLKPILAAGKTATELENEIERLYIDGKIYRNITVQVVLPSQSYFIEGEIKQPGRIQLVSGMTLMQAIAQAGGYTDFAKRTDVRIVRQGRTIQCNGKEIAENPDRDVRIEPGDRVIVARSIL